MVGKWVVAIPEEPSLESVNRMDHNLLVELRD